MILLRCAVRIFHGFNLISGFLFCSEQFSYQIVQYMDSRKTASRENLIPNPKAPLREQKQA
jgi:hypothetical protein